MSMYPPVIQGDNSDEDGGLEEVDADDTDGAVNTERAQRRQNLQNKGNQNHNVHQSAHDTRRPCQNQVPSHCDAKRSAGLLPSSQGHGKPVCGNPCR